MAAADLFFDGDGRLHLNSMAVSKVSVDTFGGRELLGADRITGGVVDPKRIYRIFRSPAALERAARSFTNVPITTQHAALGEIPRNLICGTTGSHARFGDGMLCCDGVLWTQEAINGLALGVKTSPSIGYYFEIDLKPGTFNGEHFDGRLKNIRGHHLAIVPSGRSGLHITRPIAPRSGLLAA